MHINNVNIRYKLILTAITCTLLSGCSSHNNPLLNQNSIDGLKSYYSLMLDDKSLVCPSFYANESDSKLTKDAKHYCENQLQKDYQFLSKNRQDILHGATFDDFKDIRVWKMYLS